MMLRTDLISTSLEFIATEPGIFAVPVNTASLSGSVDCILQIKLLKDTINSFYYYLCTSMVFILV